jgi:hypothetical protein
LLFAVGWVLQNLLEVGEGPSDPGLFDK